MKKNVCKNCGVEFEPSNRGKRGREQKYCSRSCGLTGSKPKRKVVCKGCGKQFIYRGRGRCIRCLVCRKHHVRSVAAEWQRENRTKLNGVGSGGAQWGPMNHEWSGGKSEYVGDYRRLCFKSHPRVCNICGKQTGTIDVHHINGDKADCSSENLVPLCRSCHKSVHYAVSATPEQMIAAFEQVHNSQSKIAEKTGKPGSG